MATNYYDDEGQYTPQSHDELEVDYEIMPPKWRIIISVLIIVLFLGALILGTCLSR